MRGDVVDFPRLDESEEFYQYAFFVSGDAPKPKRRRPPRRLQPRLLTRPARLLVQARQDETH